MTGLGGSVISSWGFANEADARSYVDYVRGEGFKGGTIILVHWYTDRREEGANGNQQRGKDLGHWEMGGDEEEIK